MENYLKKELYELVKREDTIFDFIQESSLDGVWFWDLESPEHEWMSAKFWTELGYDPAEKPHLASAWQDIIDQSDLELAIANFHKHLEDPLHPYDQVVRYRHKNGGIVWIRCRGLAIRDQNGKAIRMLGAHNNLTPIIELNEKLKSQNMELDQFSYSVSHDLRAPLRIINGYAGILKDEYGSKLDEEGNRLLFNIIKNASNMNHLIEELLSFSKLSKTELRKVEMDGGQLVEECLGYMRSICDISQFEINVSEGIPKLYADRNMIKQVVINILSNAFKYSGTSRTKRIDIAWKDLDNQIQLSFNDYGVGFDMRYYEKVFAVFQRLHAQDEFEGTGIGLALCKRIVEKHGGNIWAESTLNKGSIFYFSLKK
ncbi:ATP-binding protein [Reichenbachiella agarivorans]|uniref:histidine kinase n=1 Tax=Reichenbachiella agarivorans TaxID=2979464 RepID=A0ABY6CRW9_9BACT|nr:PAS domain-containing sensor histidine kinase [Reichenbachiella agarivorans]UXP32113.1 ATP-binding protein [Reichenbachiella agarivorans]